MRSNILTTQEVKHMNAEGSSQVVVYDKQFAAVNSSGSDDGGETESEEPFVFVITS